MPEETAPGPMATGVPIREMTISAVVLRCTCGTPEQHAGRACPASRVEDHGIVSAWYRNPLVRAWRHIQRRLRDHL